MKNSERYKAILLEIQRRSMNVPDPQVFTGLKEMTNDFLEKALVEESGSATKAA